MICYDRVREVLSATPVMKETRRELNGRSLLSLTMPVPNRSRLCQMHDVELVTEWHRLKHTITTAERSLRDGPVATAFTLNGNGRCIELDYDMSRMYTYAVGGAGLRLLQTTGDDDDKPQFESMLDVLQTAAVVLGTRSAKFKTCYAHASVEGSTIGKPELLCTIVFSVALIATSTTGCILSLTRISLVAEATRDPESDGGPEERPIPEEYELPSYTSPRPMGGMVR